MVLACQVTRLDMTFRSGSPLATMFDKKDVVTLLLKILDSECDIILFISGHWFFSPRHQAAGLVDL